MRFGLLGPLVIVDDAGRPQLFGLGDGILPRGEIADPHLVKARCVDEVIGRELAGEKPFSEAHGIVDVLECAGLNAEAHGF